MDGMAQKFACANRFRKYKLARRTRSLREVAHQTQGNAQQPHRQPFH